MDNNKDQLKNELEHLEEAKVDELADTDLESVAGGEIAATTDTELAAADCSLWCCSNG